MDPLNEIRQDMKDINNLFKSYFTEVKTDRHYIRAEVNNPTITITKGEHRVEEISSTLCLIIGLIFGGLVGCDDIKKFVGTQVDEMTPEKALKIAEQGEVFYGKAKAGIATYIKDHPGAVTPEQQAKLAAGSAAFELVYTNTKAAIIKVYAAKNEG